MAHKWAQWLHKSMWCGGSPTLQSGGQNQKWTTSGPSGYITPAVWGISDALEWGTKSEVAHKCTAWLHNPCSLGGPRHLRPEDKIRIGPQLGPLATYRLPPKGSLTLQGGGRNQKGPTSGPGGYIAVRDTLQQGTKSERADKWAHWLHNPCRLGGPRNFRAGDKIRSGPQLGPAAT